MRVPYRAFGSKCAKKSSIDSFMLQKPFLQHIAEAVF